MEINSYANLSEEDYLHIISEFITLYNKDSCEIHIESLKKCILFLNEPIIKIQEIHLFVNPTCAHQMMLRFENGTISLFVDKKNGKLSYGCYYFNDNYEVQINSTDNLYDFIDRIKKHKYKLKRYLFWISQYKVIDDKIHFNTETNILNSLPDDVSRYIISAFL